MRGLCDRGMPATSGGSIRDVLRVLPARPLMGVPQQTHEERTGGVRAAPATMPTAQATNDGRYARRERTRRRRGGAETGRTDRHRQAPDQRDRSDGRRATEQKATRPARSGARGRRADRNRAERQARRLEGGRNDERKEASVRRKEENTTAVGDRGARPGISPRRCQEIRSGARGGEREPRDAVRDASLTPMGPRQAE